MPSLEGITDGGLHVEIDYYVYTKVRDCNTWHKTVIILAKFQASVLK
jgi:hypothetical protein